MISDNVIKLDIELDVKDYVKFNFLINKSHLRNVTIIGVLLLFSFSTAFFRGIPSEKVPKVLEFIFIDIFVVGLIFFSVYYRAIKFWNSNKIAQELKHYTVTDWGISFSSDSGNSKISWDKIYKVVGSKDLFYIFISNVQAFIFPKRSFKDIDEINRFINIVSSSLPKEKLVKLNSIPLP